MSDTMICECCGKRDRRRWRHITPEGWLYAEIVRHGAEFIVPVCSETCRDAGWQPVLFAPHACDVCGLTQSASGTRSWTYFPTAEDSETAPDDKGEKFAPVVCSPECSHKIWRAGPGRLSLC